MLQDFEVTYTVVFTKEAVELEIYYPYLEQVWKLGTRELLDRVWEGLPLECALDLPAGTLRVGVQMTGLSEDVQFRESLVTRLASTRGLILAGPLMTCLCQLRDNLAGSGSAVPAPMCLQVRSLESCWILPKEDRVVVYFGVHIDAEADVVLGRALCVEFAETQRGLGGFSPPCSFYETKEPPVELGNFKAPAVAGTVGYPNVGYISFTLTDQAVRGASDDRLVSLARPVMTFRHFFLHHLITARSYLHSYLRRRIDGWHERLQKSKRRSRRSPDKRRTISGKEFTPQPA
eukprot:NODE_11187_length_1302_cov_6.912340.p1 GENE.NODE_11187_length_1302_cov_6.912340~~NODE_11187_length_1302_cov_6.912340.p1  ORF type:complete len:316 (+),score=106.85 NODE_11187_length_1302_cov_6.912340:79-948(+)